MIIDNMTWQEIANYHTNLIKKLYSNKKFLKECRKYRYNRFRKPEDGFIFNDLHRIELGNRDSIFIFYYMPTQTLEKLFILFSTFRYKREKYVAFYILNDNRVTFYRWHAIKRYFERFYNEENPQINEIDIAKMLVFNAVSIPYATILKKHFNLFDVTRDGVFLGIKEEGYSLIKTFVTHDMLFSPQAFAFEEGTERIIQYMREEYNIAI